MSLTVQSLGIGHGEHLLFEVPQQSFGSGEIYPLVGDNGSGKSTFLEVLAGLRPPLFGDIFYSKTKVQSLGPLELSRQRAILLTQKPHFSWVRVLDILEWTCDSFFCESEKKQEIIETYVEHFSLQDLLEREFTSLSDGQKQRVMLARTLCQQTPILMLDEPTTFLDVKAKSEILEKIESWATRWNKCVLFCTHEWDWLVKRDIDIFYIDQEKKELIQTRPKELIKKGLYPG